MKAIPAFLLISKMHQTYETQTIFKYLNGHTCAISVVAIGMAINIAEGASIAGTRNSSNSPQDENLPACYIQTATGKVIDLSKKCDFCRKHQR